MGILLASGLVRLLLVLYPDQLPRVDGFAWKPGVCFRGLKIGVGVPFFGSRPERSEPFRRLHSIHARARLPMIVRPPCLRAIIWSI